MEFILHSDHEALKCIQGQHKLNSKHAKWVEYLQSFHFIIKHKSRKLNKGADALSRRHLLLFQLDTCVLGFKHLKSLYASDEDFEALYLACQKHPKEDLFIKMGTFSKVHDYVSPGVVHVIELLIREVHGGSLAIMLREHYYWPSMEKDIQDVLRRCATCQIAKSHLQPQGLCTPLPILIQPWGNVSMDFILGLPLTQKNN